jgi:hypothetical protein
VGRLLHPHGALDTPSTLMPRPWIVRVRRHMQSAGGGTTMSGQPPCATVTDDAHERVRSACCLPDALVSHHDHSDRRGSAS